MKVYFPDHRTLEITQEEYEIGKVIFGDRLVLMGDHDIDPRRPYISKKTKARGIEPFNQLEILPLPREEKPWTGYVWLFGGSILFILSMLLAHARGAL